jgi:8-oxo-dGTP diphosphatase
MEEKYLFAVPQKALIKNGDKFLIVKRSSTSKTYPNHWDLPGGKLEHGENPTEGLVREVKEETSLKIKVLEPIFSYLETIIYPAYVIVYHGEILSGKIKLSHEHSEYKWVTEQELKRMLVEPYLRELFHKRKKKK